MLVARLTGQRAVVQGAGRARTSAGPVPRSASPWEAEQRGWGRGGWVLALSTGRPCPQGCRRADGDCGTLPGMGRTEVSQSEPARCAPFPISGFVRRVRRIKVLSQRELAKAVGVAPSTIGKLEAGSLQPSAPLLRRILGVAGLRLVVVDVGGRRVEPMKDWDDTRDGAGRRYPSHLDTILDPVPGDWWGDVYGLARPPETFHRNREWRDVRRRRSVWEVRVAQFRHAPPPELPEVWWRRHHGD